MFSRSLAGLAFWVSTIWLGAQENDYYTLTEIPIPKEIELEVGAIELLPNDQLAVATRRGEVYLVDNAYESPPDKVRFSLFAEGLHECLGLSYRDGWLFATQRPEVTRLRDEDGDGRADVFECVNADWGISGDYHEYAFGSRHDADGNIWVVLCLTGSSGSRADYRGWCVRVTPEGEMIPTASGIRSPGGIGANHLGDLFYTDNQGPWNGSSSLKHLKIGSFQGNPAGNRFYELTDAIGPRPPDPVSESRIPVERERIPQFVPPACVLPHGEMGQSPAGIACDSSGGRFGPFENQLFVGDQAHSNIFRIDLEKVNGVYQGACFPFLDGFLSGNVAMRFGENGALFVGGTDRGWGSRGGQRFGLERVDWAGKVPFEVREMRAKADGFELTFTHPVDPAAAGAVASYVMEAYTYIYQASYGSPVVDASKPAIRKAAVSPDGLRVRLEVEGLVRGHVHELNLPGLRSADGEPLWHPVAFYTLNEIPGRP